MAAFLALVLAATLLAACGSSSPAGAAAAASGSSAAAPATPRVTDCGTHPSARPARITIACGDGNLYLDKLHWSAWASARATATGRAEQNDCKPYCAAGHFHSYPVDVTLTKPVATPQGRMFSTVKLVFTRTSPIGQKSETTTIPTRPLGS